MKALMIHWGKTKAKQACGKHEFIGPQSLFRHPNRIGNTFETSSLWLQPLVCAIYSFLLLQKTCFCVFHTKRKNAYAGLCLFFTFPLQHFLPLTGVGGAHRGAGTRCGEP